VQNQTQYIARHVVFKKDRVLFCAVGVLSRISRFRVSGMAAHGGRRFKQSAGDHPIIIVPTVVRWNTVLVAKPAATFLTEISQKARAPTEKSFEMRGRNK
jgi:hypothetical protein